MKKFFSYLVGAFCICAYSSSLYAQRTIEFRISQISSDVGDMDAIGDSDPQWDYEISPSCGDADNGSVELSGTNCPNTRTHTDMFFSQTYDCQIPSNFNFVWRGFEDDGTGSDANTGYRTIAIPIASLNLSQSTFATYGTYTATASGTRCGGGGTVTWGITLQYRVVGVASCPDECTSAAVLLAPAGYRCGGTQTSTTLNQTISARLPCGANESSNTTAGISCDMTGAPQDVWLRTHIPDSTGGVIIQFENLGGCTGTLCQTNVTYAWYTSSTGTCSGLQYRGCSSVSCFLGCSNGQIRVDGRAGEDVWVRVWEEDDQGFQIRINQITPIAPADRCYTAMPLEGNGCNYQATSDDTGPYAEPDLGSWTAAAHPGGACQDGDHNAATNTVWSSNENMVWYTYTHPATGPFSIAVDNMSCSGGAASAQLGLFRNMNSTASPTCDLATTTGMGCAVGVGAVELLLPSLPAGNYILVVDGNAGAQCSWIFRDRIGGTLLPVNWIGFDGQMLDDSKTTRLDWRTENEVDNNGFEVQRSIDGLAFETIGHVAAHGQNVYTFDDTNIPMSPTVYYRLRQLDSNGDAAFSKTIAIETHFKLDGLSIVHNIYPNPASHEILVPFTLTQGELVNIWIYDMSGRAVMQPVNDAFYEIGQHTISIPLSSELNAGVYTLRFETMNGSQLKRFIVHK